MIRRNCDCPQCGERVVWVQREATRWRRQPRGRYVEVVWDAISETQLYRPHQCAVLADRGWRPGAGDYVPPPVRKAIERRRAKASGSMPIAQAIPKVEKNGRGLLEELGE